MAAGNGYTFPLYSPSLKAVLGFDQRRLAMLGVANDVGENVGLLAGIACNRLPPWIILLVGSTAAFLGFGVLWLAVTRSIASLPYWLLWIALCIGTNSCAWLSTGVLVTNMRNFPLSRGTVAGILKGYGGLSAAVFTAIYGGTLHNSSTKLLLFLTLGIPIVCLSLMFFIRPCSPSLENDSREHGHFLYVQISSVVLGLYLLATTLVNQFLPMSDAVSYIFIAIMVLILLAPLAIPIKMTLFPTPKKKNSNGLSSSTESQASGDPETSVPLLLESLSETDVRLLLEDAHDSDVGMLLAEGEGAVKKKRRPKRGEDFKFREVLVKADFWLLFFAYFVGVGTGVTVLNNLAQIGISAGIDNTTVLLCIFSFFNFIGRLIGGVIPEHFVRSIFLPRPAWMVCTQLMMALAYLLFTFAPGSVLYASTALLGVGYGVQISVMVPTASELFGLRHVGIIYNFIGLGNPIGAILFSGLLAGYVYDKEAAKQHGGVKTEDSSSSCLGPDCFRLTFLVLSAVSVVGSLLSVILTVRIRPVYQMLYGSGSFRFTRGSQH